MHNKKSFLLFLILFTTFLIYSMSFRNQFIWDDFHLIVNDKNIRSLQNIPIIFRTHLYQNLSGSNFYRPVLVISFMFDYFLWRLNPVGYHITNLIFHLLNIILIYFFVSRLFGNRDIGFLTCIIFALHPINTEAVTYISGRGDPLSTFFFLSALLFYMKFREKNGNLKLFFTSLLFFILAMLTKEAVLIFPLVLILYDALILGETSVRIDTVKFYLPYFVILILYIFFRLFVLGLPMGLLKHVPFDIYLLTMPKILVLYLGLLFFPIALYMERIEPIVETVFDPQFLTSLTAIICIIWLLAIAYRRNKNLFFFISFFFITLLPMMNILTINAMMAEHWLYLPAVGVYSVVAFGLAKVLDLRKPFLRQSASVKFINLFFVAYLGFFCIRTVLRNIEWGRPVEFYKNMLMHSPYSARGHINMGSIYLADKNYKLAREEFKKAAALNPAEPFCYQGLGILDYLENDKQGAMKQWRTALDIAPFYKPTRETMNKILYIENKRFRRLLRAVSEHPKNIIANYRLSKLYLQNGLYIEALERLERVLEIEPSYTNAIFNRAWLYSKLGLFTKAIKEYKDVMVLTPNDPDVYKNLGYCYFALNKHKEANQMWEKAKEKSNP